MYGHKKILCTKIEERDERRKLKIMEKIKRAGI